MKPLWRLESTAAELVANHPPRISDRNKQIVFEMAVLLNLIENRGYEWGVSDGT